MNFFISLWMFAMYIPKINSAKMEREPTEKEEWGYFYWSKYWYQYSTNKL